ncbi:hypothetical protein [Aquicoccus sp.]|uniref:hypothetical protein n=1 Tax=Aquicoccus sp. TaxID=2055851 RepID=UPI0035690983
MIVSREAVYRHRVPETVANDARSSKRRGPQGACSDADLLGHIEAVIRASPFSGEWYRKIWARLRIEGFAQAVDGIKGAWPKRALSRDDKQVLNLIRSDNQRRRQLA